MGKGVRNRKQEAKGGYVKAADMEPVLRFRPWRGTWLQITLALENLDEGKAWYVPFACSSVLGAAGQGVWAMDPPPAAAAAEAAVAAWMGTPRRFHTPWLRWDSSPMDVLITSSP